jgi:hypothetical protein
MLGATRSICCPKLTTHQAFLQSKEISVGPLRGGPGRQILDVRRQVHLFQFIVDELTNIPREVIVPVNERNLGQHLRYQLLLLLLRQIGLVCRKGEKNAAADGEHHEKESEKAPMLPSQLHSTKYHNINFPPRLHVTRIQGKRLPPVGRVQVGVTLQSVLYVERSLTRASLPPRLERANVQTTSASTSLKSSIGQTMPTLITGVIPALAVNISAIALMAGV